MKRSLTDKLIEDLLTSISLNINNAGRLFLIRHSLYGLVRLAKAEQLSQLRHDVQRAALTEARKVSRRAARDAIRRAASAQDELK